jgi:hypothetical protein
LHLLTQTVGRLVAVLVIADRATKIPLGMAKVAWAQVRGRAGKRVLHLTNKR